MRAATAAEQLTRQFVIQVNKGITTAVNQVKSAGQVKAVRYYNLQGVQVTHPDSYKGMLIQVTDYTDGTRSSRNIVK